MEVALLPPDGSDGIFERHVRLPSRNPRSSSPRCSIGAQREISGQGGGGLGVERANGRHEDYSWSNDPIVCFMQIYGSFNHALVFDQRAEARAKRWRCGHPTAAARNRAGHLEFRTHSLLVDLEAGCVFCPDKNLSKRRTDSHVDRDTPTFKHGRLAHIPCHRSTLIQSRCVFFDWPGSGCRAGITL